MCRLRSFVRGPEIVAIFGTEFTDEVCNNLYRKRAIGEIKKKVEG